MALALNEIQKPASQLAEICKTITKIPGVLSISTNMVKDDRAEVLMTMSGLLGLAKSFEFEPKDDRARPMKMSAEIGGTIFFALPNMEEWEDFCNDNHHCKVCGAEQFETTVENVWDGRKKQVYGCPNHCTDWVPVGA